MDTRFDAYAIGSVNLKLGLLNNADLQIVLDGYLKERVHDVPAGMVEEADGFGDVTTRLKINLWGNDSGKTAFAVMPLVKAPTASSGLGNNAVEGGIIFPFAAELPAGWSMGLMAEFDFLKDTVSGGYDTEFVNTVTFGHGLIGPLAGYVEFVSVASTDTATSWHGFAGIGFTYGLSDNCQLDCGVNVGVNRFADDINPFVGFAVRF
jgi:hypothetical protein